jgi:hypothetical protein
VNQDFPRVYRTSGKGRAVYLFLGVVVIALSVVGGVFFLVDAEFVEIGWLMATTCACFLLLGSYVVASALRTCVVLHADAIELHGVFSMRRMAREDIAGRRLLPMQHGPPVIKLFPRFTQVRAQTLTQYLETDPAFDAWFAGIPDIDAEEKQASLDALLEDPEVTGSKEERLARLKRARRIAGVIVFATFVICGWLWIYPHPYELAIVCTALLPWIAVLTAVRGGAVYRINPKHNDVGADLTAAVMVPGFALLVRAIIDGHVFDWEKLLMLAIAATAICVLLLTWLVRGLRADKGSVAAMGLIMMAYGYGVVALANVQLDDSEPVTYPARVLGAHVSSGKGTTHYLKLGPWGPRTNAEDVDVGREYYALASQRESVCVYLYRGALAARWFVVWDCPRE